MTAFAQPRAGFGYWLRSFVLMVRWEIASLRVQLLGTAMLQIVTGAGLVISISLLVPGDPPRAAVLYLAAGIPVVNLYTLGLVDAPQRLAAQRVSGTYDAMQSLPVPRSASAMAWFVVGLLVGVPGMVATLAVAGLRYHVDYVPSASLVAGTLLIVFCCTMIGLAIGHALRSPMAVGLVDQALIVFTVGFTPLFFPPERLPGWLQTLNWYLPFEHMSALLRRGLTDVPVPDVGRSYAIVAAWAAGCALLAGRAMTRRD